MIRAVIVEDDPMVAHINNHYLQAFKNIRVDGIFSNGKEALEYAKSHHVDLMIVDLALPVMGGAKLVEELRIAGINSDIIVVTAANDAVNISEMLKYGIIDYLVKPFDNIRFNQAIEKYLYKKNLLSEKGHFNQEDIDALLNIHSTSHTKQNSLRKGIQPATLERIISYLKNSEETSHTCESLSAELSLSRVSIRRYLNYLVEINFLSNSIDYSTGGRPSIIYHMKKQ